MAINKVKYGETTLIDLTGTTATSNTILQGYGAYGKDGVWIDGIAKQNTGMESVTQDQEGFVVLDDDEGNQIAVNPLSVTENGTYTAATGNAYNPVTVNIPSPDFIVTLTKNSNDEWEPDCTFAEAKAAYDAGKTIMSYAGIEYITNIAYNEELDAFFYVVNILGTNVDSYQYKWSAEGIEPSFYTKYYQTARSNATPSDVLSGKSFYNSSGRQTGTIATKSSSDLTVSGATVTAPAGYYSTAASKSVATGSATTPATTITANPTISVNSSGLITATTSTSQSITPTVVAGYVSSGIVGTVNVSGSKTQQLTTKGATTYTPSTTAQTIASGTYLTGTQTISGDANLVAENIKKDVSIFGVTGTLEEGGRKKFYATIVDTATYPTGGHSTYCYVTYPDVSGTKYYTIGDKFEIIEGELLFIHVRSVSPPNGIWINNVKQATNEVTYIVPPCTNITIDMHDEYDDGQRDDTIYLTEEPSDAIINIDANGTYNVSNYDIANVNVPTGGSSVESKDVNFYDYDGTILYSYTAQEFSELSELPRNPTHDGLIAQGWNWTKTYIDNQLAGAPDGVVNVGQLYITESGDTEIDVDFTNMARLSPTLRICVNGSITVDWGDNTTPDAVTGSSASTALEIPHTYRSGGNYTISIHAVSGTYCFHNTDSSGTIFTWSTNNTGIYPSYIYVYRIKRIRFGNGLYTGGIGNYAFQYCRSLESVTIPTTFRCNSYAFAYCDSLKCVVIPTSAPVSTYFVTQSGVEHIIMGQQCGSIGSYAISQCRNMTDITIPYYVSSFGNYQCQSCRKLEKIVIPSNTRATETSQGMFYSCGRLKTVIIPEKITLINASMLNSCHSLSSLTLPSTVTNIYSSAFSSNYGMKEYHFLPTTPPTLADTNAFSGIPSDCIIYVPQGCLDAYKTATNWSTYADYMQEEPA